MTAQDFDHADWRKATRSEHSNQCVEVAAVPGQVGVRDTKDRSGPVLAFGNADWRAFLDAVRTGRHGA